MKNILLIDGYRLIRNAVAHAINAEDGLRVSADVHDLPEALNRIKGQLFDVIVLDISIQSKNGFDTVNIIKRIWPDVPIVILSGTEQAEYAANYLRMGCKGYLTKHCNDKKIIEAIYAVADGLIYIMPMQLKMVIMRLLKTNKVLEGLSQREIQIFMKLALGKSNDKISQELDIAASTISVFRTQILRKMNLKSNAEIIQYAVNKHLVGLSA